MGLRIVPFFYEEVNIMTEWFFLLVLVIQGIVSLSLLREIRDLLKKALNQ